MPKRKPPLHERRMNVPPDVYFAELFGRGTPSWFKGQRLENARHILFLEGQDHAKIGVIPVLKNQTWDVASPNQGRAHKYCRVGLVNGDWKCETCPKKSLLDPCGHIMAVWGYENWIPIYEEGAFGFPPSRGRRDHSAETAANEAWAYQFHELLSKFVSCAPIDMQKLGRRGAGIRSKLFWAIYWASQSKSMRHVAGLSQQPRLPGASANEDGRSLNGHQIPVGGFYFATTYGISPISKNIISDFLRGGQEIQDLLEELLLLSAAPAWSKCEIGGIDGTGFGYEHVMEYNQQTHGREKDPKFLKSIILAMQPVPVVPAMVIGEDLGENPWAIPLMEQASRAFNISVMTGDKAYWAVQNFEYERKTGVKFFVPPKMGANISNTTLKKQFRKMLRNPEEYDAWYHRRNGVEGNNDTLKSTAGHLLHSKATDSQRLELLCRTIYHNLRMLHREQFVSPGFVIDFEACLHLLAKSPRKSWKELVVEWEIKAPVERVVAGGRQR